MTIPELEKLLHHYGNALPSPQTFSARTRARLLQAMQNSEQPEPAQKKKSKPRSRKRRKTSR